MHDLGTRAAGFTPSGPGDDAFRARLAELLAERDDGILAAYVEDGAVPYPRLREALAVQTRRSLVHPVLFGSALTGAGVEPLMAAVAELLPAAALDADGPLAGAVFKIERGEAGEKIAYVRLFSGTLRVRDRLPVGRGEEKVTAIEVFAAGPAERRGSVSAGEIAKLRGLERIRVGDRLGEADAPALAHEFALPTLETVIVPLDPADGAGLRFALSQLAEQDPLIDVRQDDVRRELSVSLYGEVQKEVIEATLAADYGVAVAFRETTTICIEQLIGSGAALEVLRAKTKTNVTGKSSPISSNPFPATLGLRVEPGPIGSAIRLGLDVDVRLVPADALRRAGSVVCEPFFQVSLEVPTGSIGTVLPALARLGGVPGSSTVHDGLATLEALVPAARLQGLRRQLPGLTGGEGVVETSFAGYHPVSGDPPERRRTTPNPLNRQEYLVHLAKRGGP